MAKGDRKVQSDDCSGDENGSDSDEEFESPSYDDLVVLLNDYTKIIRKTRAKNEKLKLENESLLEKYDIAEKASDELREEKKIVSSKLKELKTSKKELREKHDKLEGIHNELTTRYNLLKQEYTNLINYDNLVLSHEFLSNEPHHATNNVVKIDIATSCDDLIIDSIEQDCSSKNKKANEKLKKDLEKLSTTNTIVKENLDNDHDLTLENEILREENKRLQMEKALEKQTTNESLQEENKKLKLKMEHLKNGLSKFTRGHYLQSELLMNTVMKMDRSGIGFLSNKRRKLKLNINNTSQSLSRRDDKKVTLLMSVKLHHHNPCPCMLDPLLTMLTSSLERMLKAKPKLCS
ncbi:uncharacterized protein [Miscanthus floridulus]|uniref:uncharacterized protein n=1 Tax=Miscanthus floridulus TaxID=154761 RepID=UPI0034586F35